MGTAEISQEVGSNFRAYVHLGRGSKVAKQRERYLRGETNDLTPYGFHLAEEMGAIVTFSNDEEYPASPVAAKLNWWGNRLLRFDFGHAWANRKAVTACDVVWTMTEGEAFAIAALMMIRAVRRKPIIGNAVWLFDRWNKIPKINRRLFRILSHYISIMTVHSQKCIAVARASLPNLCCELTHFGINPDIYQINSPKMRTNEGPIRVFAAGNDATRDWATFLSALGNDTRFSLNIWTPALTPEILAQYNNVLLPKPILMVDIMALYDQCDVVVVPMVDNIFSGITVALEAVALGKPVICSNTGGVTTYFNENEIRYVPLSNAAELREAVLRVFTEDTLQKANAAQASFSRNQYTTRAMIAAYIKLTSRYLDTGVAGNSGSYQAVS